MRAFVLEADWQPRAGYRLTPAEVQTRKPRQASQVWRNPRLVQRQVPEPTPGPGEVVVEVGAVGVCGSDTHCIETDAEGYVLFSGPARLPVTLGHEYTGIVRAVGPGVGRVRVGEAVAAEGMLYCGRCEACLTGHPNQCPHLDMTGFSRDGAYADQILVHERFLWSLEGLAEHLGSRSQALELGALVEPISCPFNGIWVAGRGMSPGAHVAVYGCGPIGLGAIALCRAAGAASIAAFDVVPERVELARQLGADVAWDMAALEEAGGSPSEVVGELSRGWGADLQVEAAGAATQLMPEIERSFAPGGQMVYLSRTGERAPVELDVLVTGAAGINGSRGHAGGGCFPRVIRLLERGVIQPGAMITARMGAHEVAAALERSRTRVDGKILVVREA